MRTLGIPCASGCKPAARPASLPDAHSSHDLRPAVLARSPSLLVAATLGGARVAAAAPARAARCERPRTIAAATTVFRDQKRQLDADLAAGAITRRRARRRRSTSSPRASARSSHASHGAVAPAVPTARAVDRRAGARRDRCPSPRSSLYFVARQSRRDDAAARRRRRARADAAGRRSSRWSTSLAQRMKANPDDPKGWVLLGRSYRGARPLPTRRSPRTREAAERLPRRTRRCSPTGPRRGDGAGTQARRASRPSCVDARARARSEQPEGAGAGRRRRRWSASDLRGAIAQWRKLRALLPPGSDDAREIDAVIAQLEAQRCAAAPVRARRAPRAAPTVAAAPQRTPAPAASRRLAVTGRVELDPKLARAASRRTTRCSSSRAPPTDRGCRSPCMRIRRRRAAARVSRSTTRWRWRRRRRFRRRRRGRSSRRASRKSGNATPQPGDLRGASAPVAPGARRTCAIVIDDVVPMTRPVSTRANRRQCSKRTTSPARAATPHAVRGVAFRVERGTRARRHRRATAAARRRCCACSPASPRPPPARSAGAASRSRRSIRGCATPSCSVGHLPALKDELTARGEPRVAGRARRRRAPRDATRATRSTRVALGAQRALPARVLSQGQRRRIGLARLRSSRAAAVDPRRAGDRARRRRRSRCSARCSRRISTRGGIGGRRDASAARRCRRRASRTLALGTCAAMTPAIAPSADALRRGAVVPAFALGARARPARSRCARGRNSACSCCST